MRQVSEHEARQALSDAAMRRGFFEWLWQFNPEASGDLPRPCPCCGDDQIKDELRRIFGTGRGWPW